MSSDRLRDIDNDDLDAREAFEEAWSELRDAQRRVDALFRELGEQPDPDGPKERELLETLALRRRLATRFGLSALRWHTTGGSVVLEEATPQPAPPLEEGGEVDLTEILAEMVDPDGGEFLLEPIDATTEEVLDEVLFDEDPPEPEPGEPLVAVITLPAPPPERKPKSPPATVVSLEELAAKFRGEIDPAKESLKRLLETLGMITKVVDGREYEAQVSRLVSATSRMDEMLKHPKDIQKALMGAIASKARYLQDDVIPTLDGPVLTLHLDGVFSKLTAFSKEHRPGFVFGLQRHHKPEFGSWRQDFSEWWERLWHFVNPNGGLDPDGVYECDDDGEPILNPERELHRLSGAVEAEDPERDDVCLQAVRCLKAKVRADDPRLVKMLMPHAKLLTKEPRLKAVRKAIRDFKKEMDQEGKEADADHTVLPEDWPYWEFTRGKNAVIIGGDNRVRVQRRIEKTFDLASLEWESGWNVRRNEAIASQVASGQVQLVIFLARFMSHQAWDIIGPACKDTDGVESILVERGYGVSQIRRVMEKSFAGKVEDDG